MAAEAEDGGPVPDPRETIGLVGHEEPERMLLEAFRAGRMHHAWLLTGPAGIGKATLAYRLARFMLAHPDPSAPEVAAARDLSVDPEHPAARRVARQSHPDLFRLARSLNAERKTLASEIRVDDVRRISSFFAATAGEGGWRLAVVDTADDLNTNAANALLKLVEEPPPRSVFLILAASPRRLPATLRSRCRVLRMRPLGPDEVTEVLRGIPTLTAEYGPDALAKAAASAGGSVGRAIAMLQADEAEVGARVAEALAALPRVDSRAAIELADFVAAHGEGGLTSFVERVLDHAHVQARSEAEAGAARLARWAEVWEKVAETAREVEIYNLDKRPFVLSTLTMLAAASR